MKFPESKTLETSRCRLRYISKDDIPHIFQAAQYPSFTDGMLWNPPANEEELIAPYENNVKAWTEDQAYCFTIETKDASEFIGRISIRKQKEENVWDLGFWTHPEQQSKGYMSEAVQAVIEFGFRQLQASRIVACHALWNKQSEKVLKKNGMTFIEHIPEGFKKNGKWIEENLLGLTSEDWKNNQAEQVSGHNSGGCPVTGSSTSMEKGMNDPDDIKRRLLEEKRRMIKEWDAEGGTQITAEEGARFIRTLKRFKWKEDFGFIYSPSGGLNFPCPEGWLGSSTFDGLREIMDRRIKRVDDLEQMTEMSVIDREIWLKEHKEVLKAIAEAE